MPELDQLQLQSLHRFSGINERERSSHCVLPSTCGSVQRRGGDEGGEPSQELLHTDLGLLQLLDLFRTLCPVSHQPRTCACADPERGASSTFGDNNYCATNHHNRNHHDINTHISKYNNSATVANSNSRWLEEQKIPSFMVTSYGRALPKLKGGRDTFGYTYPNFCSVKCITIKLSLMIYLKF